MPDLPGGWHGVRTSRYAINAASIVFAMTCAWRLHFTMARTQESPMRYSHAADACAPPVGLPVWLDRQPGQKNAPRPLWSGAEEAVQHRLRDVWTERGWYFAQAVGYLSIWPARFGRAAVKLGG